MNRSLVTYIYCHFGGHPDYQALHNNPFSLGFGRKELKQVGKILLNHYKDVKKVKELIALGDKIVEQRFNYVFIESEKRWIYKKIGEEWADLK